MLFTFDWLLIIFTTDTQEKGVTVISVGIGDSVNDNELKEIAMGSENNFLKLPSFSDMDNHIRMLAETFCKKGGFL